MNLLLDHAALSLTSTTGADRGGTMVAFGCPDNRSPNSTNYTTVSPTKRYMSETGALTLELTGRWATRQR